MLWATGIAWVATRCSLHRACDVVKKRCGGASGCCATDCRVPGDIALGALLTVPGYVALRTHGLDVSGDVGFGATLLNLAAAAFSPVALLLLPATAGRLAAGEHASLEQSIGRMTWVILAASVALMLGFELLSEPLLLAYLGPSGAAYIPMARIIFIGALPFAFSTVCAVCWTPTSTHRATANLTAAFGILLLGSVVHLAIPTPWYTMGVVLVLSMFGWAGPHGAMCDTCVVS